MNKKLHWSFLSHVDIQEFAKQFEEVMHAVTTYKDYKIITAEHNVSHMGYGNVYTFLLVVEEFL